MKARYALALRAARVTATVLVMLVPAVLAGVFLAAVRGSGTGRRHVSRRVATLLMALGPTFVKAGQVLGTRRDVLPAALCDELSVLQDSVTPLDEAQTAAALRAAYGDDAGEVFAEL